MERLVDLQEPLLIQEERNEDLEKGFLELETLNKVQGEIIQNMSSCDCTPNEKATSYLSDGRYYLHLLQLSTLNVTKYGRIFFSFIKKNHLVSFRSCFLAVFTMFSEVLMTHLTF